MKMMQMLLIEKRKDNGSLIRVSLKKELVHVSSQRQAEIDAEKNRVLEENKAIYEQQTCISTGSRKCF
jgi:hypothetical protein